MVWESSRWIWVPECILCVCSRGIPPQERAGRQTCRRLCLWSKSNHQDTKTRIIFQYSLPGMKNSGSFFYTWDFCWDIACNASAWLPVILRRGNSWIAPACLRCATSDNKKGQVKRSALFYFSVICVTIIISVHLCVFHHLGRMNVLNFERRPVLSCF